MRPLFTVHAGELLVGEYIERHFRHTRVWVPSKDTGIDLLVTDKKCRRTVSLQVKFSRDFLVTHQRAAFQEALRACGWWTFNPAKIQDSTADFWVLVLIGFAHRTTDYIVIRPKDLFRRLKRLHPNDPKIQTYFWTTADDKCWETRNVGVLGEQKIADGHFRNGSRDFTRYLNNWAPIVNINRI